MLRVRPTGGDALATHKSAEKRARQALRRRARNRQGRSRVRSAGKAARDASASGPGAGADALRAALARLNPDLPEQARELAVAELTRGRSTMLPAQASREIYTRLKNGVRIEYRTADGEQRVDGRFVGAHEHATTFEVAKFSNG